MAKRANNTRVSARANPTIEPSDILADAAKTVCDRKRTIGVLAEVLAEQMQKLHGGEWRLDIDHGLKSVVIRQCSDKLKRPIAISELREAV